MREQTCKRVHGYTIWAMKSTTCPSAREIFRHTARSLTANPSSTVVDEKDFGIRIWNPCGVLAGNQI